jgi:Ca-activated chloride channel family protein
MPTAWCRQNATTWPIPVFERISELAPNEPQSWRDLGLALADDGQPQRAVNALWEVVSRPWNGRFAGVNMIALAELNAIAAQATAAGKASDIAPLDMSRVDTRLRRNLPLALRVVMAWDADDTDIDMWVTDPNGERASYANRLTRQGGAMSPDATGGYGPEEFSLKPPRPASTPWRPSSSATASRCCRPAPR